MTDTKRQTDTCDNCKKAVATGSLLHASVTKFGGHVMFSLLVCRPCLVLVLAQNDKTRIP